MNRSSAATAAVAVFCLALAAWSTPSRAADPRVADFLQAGRIRAALFLPQYTKDTGTGEPRGTGTGLVAVEVSRLLAARLGVEAQIVGYPTPADAAGCLKAGTCDVAFMGIEPERAAEVDFSPPVIQFDYTFLVPAGSKIQNAADADRSGVRIAYVAHHAASLALMRAIKNAELIAADLPDAAFDLLRTGKADAFALARPQLVPFAAKLPGSRMLDGGYGINRLAIALQKGQAARLAYVGEFVEDAKASGAIARALEHSGLRGIQVSPPGHAGTQ
jgi:polar amino acid transport system substrate-binding protein